jgi:septum formation protein
MKMILENLTRYDIILGSNSPRRKELLAGLDINFTVKVIPGIDESYPYDLNPVEVPVYLSKLKAKPYLKEINEKTLLITADTIVNCGGEILGKPKDKADAIEMLRKISGNTHEVVSGVCITSKEKTISFGVVSKVSFAELTDEEIEYYVDKYKPFDKAGSYGIQEWIGYVGVEGIEGSFYNVMGLPVQRLYEELKRF